MTNNLFKSEPPARYFWIDWLRFGAALGVLICHVRSSNWVDWVNLAPSNKGTLSALFFALTRPSVEYVVIFFVLSGFLVGGKLLERVLLGSFDLRIYAIDRFTRVWVPLIPALALTALIEIIAGHRLSYRDLGASLVGTQGVLGNCFGGNAPLWSLAYEIWFYVLAGAWGIIMVRHKRQYGAFSLFGISLMVFMILDSNFLFYWCFGALGYMLKPAKNFKTTLLFSGLLVGAGLTFSQLSSESNSWKTESLSSVISIRPISLMVMSIGLALFIPVLSRLKPAPGYLTIEKAGSRFAAFSYTLYLIHYPLLALINLYTRSRFSDTGYLAISWFTLKILFCLLAAWVFHLPFEAQTDRVRRWLQPRVL